MYELNICELCQCEPIHNFHHLIPKTLHSNKWFKKRYSRADLSKGIDICRECHKTIHRLIPSEKELGRHYYTVGLLLAHEGIAQVREMEKKKRGRFWRACSIKPKCAEQYGV